MDLQTIVTTIRALVISRPQMTTLQDLIKEYRHLEGENIPFRKLGFPSLEDFLDSTGSFKLRSSNGQTIVSAVLKEESAHLVQMIAAQKKPKSKSRGALANRPDINRFDLQPRYPANHRFPASASTQRPPNGIQDRTLPKSKPFNQEIRKKVPPPVPRKPKLIPIYPENNRIKGSEAKLTNNAPSVNNGHVKSLNERLLRQQSHTPPLSNNNVVNGFSFPKSTVLPAGYIEPEVSIYVKAEPKKVILDKDTETPVEDLEAYCEYMDYNLPYYNHTSVALGGQRMFHCRVTVMNKTYCSYPEHCFSEEEAQRVAAKLAIRRLILEEDIRKFPICQEDDVCIAEKLLEILKEYPRGVLATAIPEFFRQKYGMSLSGNWLNIVHKYYIFTVEQIGERQIVYSPYVQKAQNDYKSISRGAPTQTRCDWERGV